MTDPNKLLQKEVAAVYKVKDWKGGHRQDFGSFGTVDLKKLTLKRAANLVAAGFPKLVKKQPKKTKEDTTNTNS